MDFECDSRSRILSPAFPLPGTKHDLRGQACDSVSWSRVFDSHKICGQYLMLYPSQSSENDEMANGSAFVFLIPCTPSLLLRGTLAIQGIVPF